MSLISQSKNKREKGVRAGPTYEVDFYSWQAQESLRNLSLHTVLVSGSDLESDFHPLEFPAVNDLVEGFTKNSPV